MIEQFCPCLEFISSYFKKRQGKSYQGTQEIEEEQFINQHHEDITLDDKIKRPQKNVNNQTEKNNNSKVQADDYTKQINREQNEKIKSKLEMQNNKQSQKDTIEQQQLLSKISQELHKKELVQT